MDNLLLRHPVDVVHSLEYDVMLLVQFSRFWKCNTIASQSRLGIDVAWAVGRRRGLDLCSFRTWLMHTCLDYVKCKFY